MISETSHSRTKILDGKMHRKLAGNCQYSIMKPSLIMIKISLP